MPKNWFESDSKFDQLYTEDIQLLSGMHWTPLEVASKAIDFLASAGQYRILDIGSGVGKFCLTAGYYKPSALIYGIEQRMPWVLQARKARQMLGLENVCLLQVILLNWILNIMMDSTCITHFPGIGQGRLKLMKPRTFPKSNFHTIILSFFNNSKNGRQVLK